MMIFADRNTRAPSPALPRLLLEDRLALLRACAVGAWLLLAAMLGIEATFRLCAGLQWPTVAGFSYFYNVQVGAFALNTLVLTTLLLRRQWYERVPRQAEHRVGWLLALVLLWLGLHLCLLFYLSGGFAGPLLALLPVLLIAALSLPGQAGWWLAGYVLALHLGITLLARWAILPPRSPLAAAFSLHHTSAPLGWITLGVVAIAAVAMAAWVRRWTYPGARPDHPGQRIDPETGLFRAQAVLARVRLELRRSARLHSSCSLVVLGLPAAGANDVAYARVIVATSRLGSDMPARLEPGCVAIMLAAVDGGGAQAYCRRLAAAFESRGLATPHFAGVVVGPASAASAEEVVERARAALGSATAGAEACLVAL